MKTAKQDQEVMKLLKVSEISRIICDTNMGTLKLRIRKGETDYQFVLDAVELPKNLNKELMELIYPKKIEIPQVNKLTDPQENLPKAVDELLNSPESKKQHGRPKKK